jgi:ABC-2 type transport system permease protein
MVRLDPQGQPIARPTPEHLKLRDDGEDADEEETERPSAVAAGELMTDSDAEDVALQQQEEELYRVMVPIGVAMIMYMVIFSSSGLLLNSVIEEKENRTLEILLTSLLPRELLAGKVLGLGVLGLGQSLIWFGTSGLLLAMRNDTPDFFSFTLPLAIWLLLCIYCLSGYLIYASLMAGIGAVVSSTREASLFTGFLIMPFMVPLIFYGVIIDQPDSMLALGLSIFPLTAPVTMMMRVILTHVTWWQITLSLLVMAGSVMVCIWLAARAFRISTLLTGKKLNPMTIWRALQG